MKTKDLKDLRTKNLDELKKLLNDNKTDLIKVNLDLSTGQESNLKKAKLLKKDLAQIQTIIREKEIIEESKGNSSTSRTSRKSKTDKSSKSKNGKTSKKGKEKSA